MAKVADGIRYAERVVAGEIVAGEFVRLACQRFLDDLKYGEERGIYFSEPRAQHILNFYKFVPHVKGALAGQPIELMDWHVFILINIFGFVIPLVNEETGEVVMRSDGSGRPVMVRRFRTAYNEVARKNAKSTLSSGIGLYMTGADGEGGAEVYSAATTRDQARIVFEDAKNMVRKARSTLGRLFDFNKLAIYQEQSASKFEPLSSDANNLDGLNIHCAIIDELHAHKTRDVWDVLETATGARLQSLLFGITTAGFNKEGICYEQRDYAIKVLRGYNSDVEGAVKDDSYFAIIYTLDEGDDPFDETVWQKANPGLGICKRWDDLRRLAKKAKEQVSARVNFFTKHMNVWVTAESAWMDMIKWEKCEYIAPRHELKTYPMWVGVDLAHKIDICAAAKLWRTDNGHVHADFKFWLPEGRLERCSRQQAELYRKWAEMDKLILTDGDVIDHAQIKSDLLEWIGGENLRELGFDPWSAMQFSLALAEEGIPLVEVPQTVRNLSEAMKETESLVYAGRFHHSNHPVMNWMMSNVTVKPDKNDNIFPNKSTLEAKIDGPVAMFTAMSRMLVNGGDQSAAIQQIQKVQVDTNNNLNSMWAVKLQQMQDGRLYIAGIGAGIENTPDGMQSQVLLAADRIAMINPANGNTKPMFVGQGDQIFMNEVFLKYLTAPTITSGGNPPTFSLTPDGRLTAKNADISGNVNANSGTLNNVTINENCRVLGKLSANQIEGDLVKTVGKAFPRDSRAPERWPSGTITVRVYDDQPFDRQIVIPAVAFSGAKHEREHTDIYSSCRLIVRKNGAEIYNRTALDNTLIYSGVIDMPAGHGHMTLEFSVSAWLVNDWYPTASISDLLVVVMKKSTAGISIS
ncbi:TPA: terminase TerL endonuclease subunit [Escherichia coli]